MLISNPLTNYGYLQRFLSSPLDPTEVCLSNVSHAVMIIPRYKAVVRLERVSFTVNFSFNSGNQTNVPCPSLEREEGVSPTACWSCISPEVRVYV